MVWGNNGYGMYIKQTIVLRIPFSERCNDNLIEDYNMAVWNFGAKL